MWFPGIPALPRSLGPQQTRLGWQAGGHQRTAIPKCPLQSVDLEALGSGVKIPTANPGEQQINTVSPLFHECTQFSTQPHLLFST